MSITEKKLQISTIDSGLVSFFNKSLVKSMFLLCGSFVNEYDWRTELVELFDSFNNLQDDKKFQTAYFSVCDNNKKVFRNLHKFGILQA